jgi:hypothetical protein
VSQNSIAEDLDLRQDRRHSKRLVDAAHLTQLAEALYRFDTRKPDAQLSLLDQVSQEKYRNDAAVVAYMRDPGESTPAFYFAAAIVTQGELGSFPRAFRRSIVGFLDVAFCAYRKALARSADLDLRKLDALAKLAEADHQQAKAEQSPEPTPLTVNALADMTTGKEVH